MKGGSCSLNMTLRIFEIEGLFQHSGTTFSIAHHLSRHNQIRDQGKKESLSYLSKGNVISYHITLLISEKAK